ncbi:alginate O-acetyltransferase AlgX-related protein [Nannocystaceae bacterium ST9]
MRRSLIASQIVLGLVLGLVGAEYVFAKRDEGAFPHVNFYVADPDLGVRLEPGATMKFRLRENPLTTIHVNAQGYRGEDWPTPTPDAAPGQGEIVVLGDSQVFGLGVEDGETFSAKLAAASGRTVLNAGVPTYGPPEYLLLARELLAEREPQVLVVTLNYLNDPFELDRPNKDRHAVWDGWAVRAEHAPAEVREFPGRKWLYSQSHAFYAFRRWQHERGKAELPEAGESVDFGTPTEGVFSDLVVESQQAHAAIVGEREKAEAALLESRERLGKLDQELADKRDSLDDLLYEASGFEFDDFQQDIARGRPGDIVEEEYAEEGRSVVLTAALIRKAARERDKHVAKLIQDQDRRRKTEAKDLVDAQKALADERVRLREQIAAGVPLLPPPTSVFDGYLRELQALCAEHGTELIVIALPVDVQVDPSEWDKYEVDERPDMSESLVLLADLVANAEQLGIRALDATAALQGAEPGAFLDHDIHMTPKGHAALAEALAERMAAPLPIDLPGSGLPEGRSFVPAYAEWEPADEVMVAGSTKAGCVTQIDREWLKVRCGRKTKREVFGSIELIEGRAPATMMMHTADGFSLVTPLTVGENLTARLHWNKQIRELQIRWPAGADGQPKFAGSFVAIEGTPTIAEPSMAATRLCNCHQQVHQENWCEQAGGTDYSGEGSYYVDGCRTACTELWGDPTLVDACDTSFASDCGKLLACVQNDPLFAPNCPEGSVHAFASNACFVACDEAHPCPTGSCTPWQAGGVCR